VQAWGPVVSIAVGGLVAVGFLDEERVIVGSHSGVGVFDASTGTRLERMPADDYSWYQGDPPFIRRPGPAGCSSFQPKGCGVASWTALRLTAGAVSCGPTARNSLPTARHRYLPSTAEDRRAHGFSSGGRTFVYATSASLNLVHR
jgi:hypothetical protein